MNSVELIKHDEISEVSRLILNEGMGTTGDSLFFCVFFLSFITESWDQTNITNCSQQKLKPHATLEICAFNPSAPRNDLVLLRTGL